MDSRQNDVKNVLHSDTRTTKHEHVACTVCGCVCDDLTFQVRDGRVVALEPSCPLAEAYYLGRDDGGAPVSTVMGKPVPFSLAVASAANVLRAARAPIIYGLSRSSSEGQRSAIALADFIGATIDTTASHCHAASVMAFQQVGESTCTLGETKTRADLVIYWGANPLRSHPRHLDRYALYPKGTLLPGGRADRALVVVDIEPTATSALADHTILLTPGSDFEVLTALRALVRGIPLAHHDVGADVEQLTRLAESMKKCRSGVVFFGLGLARTGLGHRNVQALLDLVTELNRYTCFYARRMRVYGDVTGADSVLCWQTGYPFSVNLGRGYPRYNPGEFSANDMLERQEVDACLLLGSEGVEKFSPSARAALARIPTIAVDYPGVAPAINPTVAFATAVYGLHRIGTAYRMDEVPIPLRQVIPSLLPSDAEVLNALRFALSQPPP